MSKSFLITGIAMVLLMGGQAFATTVGVDQIAFGSSWSTSSIASGHYVDVVLIPFIKTTTMAPRRWWFGFDRMDRFPMAGQLVEQQYVHIASRRQPE